MSIRGATDIVCLTLFCASVCEEASGLEDDIPRKLVLHEIHTDGFFGEGTDDQSRLDMRGRDMAET